ncbi:MAG TPA: hypothetical protein VIL20_14755 [Sandaracinaceae bacterium]
MSVERRQPRPAARAVALAVALAACGGPPPGPPALASVELTPIASPLGDHVLVLGLPGSTEPGLDVYGVDLDAPLPRAEGFVAADGSFLLEVPGREGDLLRISTERAGLRSAPIDVVAVFGPATLAPIALPCLRVPSVIVLGQAVVLENECDDAVVVDALALRAPAPLEVRTSAPLTIAAGERAVLDVRRTGPEPVDEVLLVTVSSPLADRRAITVLAR